MAGRVGDDELALRRGEEAIGHVDGDALLALGFQPVDQQREVNLLAGCAVAARIALQRGELVLEDQLGVVEQAADQRRLAVVDGTTGEKAQEGAPVVVVEHGADVEAQLRLGHLVVECGREVAGGGHQK